jgi:hypothetical protein
VTITNPEIAAYLNRNPQPLHTLHPVIGQRAKRPTNRRTLAIAGLAR